MNLFLLSKVRKLGSLWMIVAGFFFAVMGVLVKIESEKFSSAELVFYRSFFGLVFIFSVTKFKGQSLRTNQISKHLTRSIFGFVSLLLFFYAISELPLATAVTLNYTSPLFMALMTPLMLHEKPKISLLIEIIIGFIGVIFLLRPSMHFFELVNGLIGLFSGFLAGVVYINVTQLGRSGEPDWRTVFYYTLACSVGAALWMLFHQFHFINIEDFGLLLCLGTTATIAQLAMTRAYRTGNPLVVGSLAYSTVVFASLFELGYWHEVISPSRLLGIALIISSGLISIRSTNLKN